MLFTSFVKPRKGPLSAEVGVGEQRWWTNRNQSRGYAIGSSLRAPFGSGRRIWLGADQGADV